MTTDLYTQYRSYIKQQLMNKSNSELQIIHELLVSDFESRDMFIWGTISLGAILALIVSISKDTGWLYNKTQMGIEGNKNKNR